MRKRNKLQQLKTEKNMKNINIKTLLVMVMLCFTWSMGATAQTEFFTDNCSSSTGWTLGQGSTTNGRYTAWRVSNTCSIDGNTLAINARYSSGSWACEYWWDIDASSGIVAYKTIDASNYENLNFTFDYVSDGNSSDYGRIGYSTDGGSTFTWLYTGGPYGNGKYYNKSTIQRDNSVSLPASLNEASFQIAFRWKNNASGGDDPAMYVDNIRVSGDATSTTPSTYEEFYVNDCSTSSEWTLGQGTTSGSLYTAWRIGTTSTIDGSTIGVNAWNGSTWLNEYWWNINNSSGIVAYTTVDASNHENLKLKFDFLADGNSSDYGKVGYSTDGGTTFTWIATGGKLGAGKYYNLNTINRDEEIILPTSLDATSFEVAFIWYNNASGGDDPAIYFDNIRVGGDKIADDKDDIVYDDLSNTDGWILSNTDSVTADGNYTGWRITDDCTIDSSVLAIATFDDTLLTWSCGYYNNLDNSNGIIARKEINTKGYKNLDLTFDWNAGGESTGSTGVDYGQVGYTLDEGITYTWLATGGKNGLGEFYQQSGTVNEFYTLPVELSNTVFQIAFKWTNNASNGTNPGFTIDNVSIQGDPMAVPLTTIASDDFETSSNWTLTNTDPNSNGDYTSWNVSSNCGINNKSLIINKRDGNDFSWNCGIEPTIDNSSGIIAYRAIDATNANNLVLSFNWKCDSEGLPEYGSVVYSLDGGLTFSALSYGGDGGGFYFQNSSVKSETVLLPSLLDNTNFLIGFQWHNDTEQAGAIPFTVDDLEIKGVYTGTELFATSGINSIGTINSTRVEIIREAGKQTESQVDILDEWGKQMSVSYMDGLGRNIQNVNYRATPNHKDFVTPVVYNKYGQTNVNYASYPNSATNGSYTKNWSFDQSIVHSVLKGEDYPKAVAIVERSPRAKVDEQGSIGAIFQPGGKTLKPKTAVDIEGTFADGNYIKAIEIQSDGTLKVFKYSAANGYSKLYVSEVWDTEGIITKSYTNSEGQTILVKKQDTSGTVLSQVYSVYDEYKRLRFVVQPQGVANLPNLDNFPNGFSPVQDFIDDWCFQYKYDKRGRMISKRVPGGGWVEMAYDKWDRLVITQDAVQLGKSPQEFSFIKYDRLNRPITTGIFKRTTGIDIDQLRIELAASTGRYESRVGATYSDYSDNQSYPPTSSVNDLTLLIMTFYDDYNYFELSPYPFKLHLGYVTSDQKTNVKGMVTGTKTKILGTASDYIFSVTYYDEYNRPIQNQTKNHTGVVSDITTKYDFVGNILETYEVNNAYLGGVYLTTDINTRSEYDHMNRLTKTYHDVNEEGEVLLAEYNYNEFGEQTEKNLHSTDNGATFLQSVDYTYNSKGWLTQINDINLNAGLLDNDDNADLFGMKLKYFGITLSGKKPKYNGNISEIEWQNANGERSLFGYEYDGLERIKEANFREYIGSVWQQDKFSLTDINYDKNGNITDVKRNGQLGNSVYGQIDDLTYTYDGNRLLSVSDAVGSSYYGFDFEDGNTTGNDYVYNVNGNLIEDKNKAVTGITYNILNLVDKVEYDQSTGNEILYIYDANGIKLSKQVTTADAITRTVHYINSIQFENDVLAFVNTGEGRAVPDGDPFDYEYFLRDQVGNTRITFHEHPDSSGVAKLLNSDDYYPFGMTFNSITASTNEYKFQGQEHQGDHNLNWTSFKWRNSQPDLGRFFNTDPLAHNYVYNSPFAFSENQVINAVELEGLEKSLISGGGVYALTRPKTTARATIVKNNLAKSYSLGLDVSVLNRNIKGYDVKFLSAAWEMNALGDQKYSGTVLEISGGVKQTGFGYKDAGEFKMGVKFLQGSVSFDHSTKEATTSVVGAEAYATVTINGFQMVDFKTSDQKALKLNMPDYSEVLKKQSEDVKLEIPASIFTPTFTYNKEAAKQGIIGSVELIIEQIQLYIGYETNGTLGRLGEGETKEDFMKKKYGID